MPRMAGEPVCSVPYGPSERSLALPSPGRPAPGSRVPPPGLRPPGGPHPDALRTGTGIGIGAILFPLVASPALGRAPASFRLLGPSLGLLGAPFGLFGPALGRPGALFGLPGALLCLLGPFFGLPGAPFGLLGSPLSSPGALFGFLDPSLGFFGALLGLRGASLGFAPTPFGLLGAHLGFLDSSLGLLGTPMGPGRPPVVEGKHGVEEIHVVVRRYPRKFLRGLSRELLLGGQLPRYLRCAPGLSAKVAHHGVEEVFDLLGAQLLGRRRAFGGRSVCCHEGA